MKDLNKYFIITAQANYIVEADQCERAIEIVEELNNETVIAIKQYKGE